MSDYISIMTDTTQKYKLIKNANIIGLALRNILSSKQQSIVETFFQPSLDGWVAPDKGYDECQWTFEDGEGRLYNCYRRYGSMRVGALPETPVEDFLDWIDTYGTAGND